MPGTTWKKNKKRREEWAYVPKLPAMVLRMQLVGEKGGAGKDHEKLEDGSS